MGVRISPPVQTERKMEGLIAYFRESYEELVQRVTWPTWKDLQSSAIVVAIASLIIALIIGMMDMASNLLFNDVLYKLAG
jgi:preprotein translocase subunit SecE